MLKKLFLKIFFDTEVKEELLFLHNIEIFKYLTISQLRKLRNLIYKKTYIKNEVIYEKGQDASLICILKKGKVELCNADNKTPLLPNTIFGKKYLLRKNECYAQTAKVAEKSEVYMIHKEDIETLMNSDNSVGFKIAKVWLEKFYGKE